MGEQKKIRLPRNIDFGPAVSVRIRFFFGAVTLHAISDPGGFSTRDRNSEPTLFVGPATYLPTIVH